jgi:hypothetical protein
LILDLVLPLRKSLEDETSRYEIVQGKGGYARYYWVETKNFKFIIDPDVWENSQPGDTFEVSYSPIFRVVHRAKDVALGSRIMSVDTKLYLAFYILPFVLLATCIISLYQKDEYNMLFGLIISVIISAVIIGFGMPGIWKLF